MGSWYSITNSSEPPSPPSQIANKPKCERAVPYSSQRPYKYLEDKLKDNNQIYRSREQTQRRISSYQYHSLASSTYKAPESSQIESSKNKTYHSSISREDDLPQETVKDQATKTKKYEFTNEDAKVISKKGFQEGDQKYTVEECRAQMKKQMHKLNNQYNYSFTYQEQPHEIPQSKKMTRTIYLSFVCNRCNKQNRWTSIGGTFQVTFKYDQFNSSLVYHINIYRTQCQHCLKYIEPKVYKTQMEAMKMFFSVIVTNIIDNKPPPKKPERYNIRPIHWHKEEWCEACKLGKCTTQNRK